jgi:hypothetical protein
MNQNQPRERTAGSVPIGAGDERPKPDSTRRAELEKEENPSYVTIEQVQEIIADLAQTMTAGLATRDELNAVARGMLARHMDIARRYPTREEAQMLAKEAVPRTLRYLDQSSNQRQGNILLLSSGGASGGDSAYWGQLKLGSGAPAVIDNWEFGVSAISGVNVTLRAGRIIHGQRAPILVPETNLAITQDGQIAYLTYALASGAATVRLANTFPFSGSGTVVRALQSFRLISGEEEEEAQATKLITYHRGTVCVDACYA